MAALGRARRERLAAALGRAARRPLRGASSGSTTARRSPASIAVEGRRARESTSPARPASIPGNLNAPPAVVRSAVLYVLRLLIAEPLPLNEGLLRAGGDPRPARACSNPPFPDDPAECPAVVGGNVETSQRRGGHAAQGARPRRLQPGDDEQPALRQSAASASTRPSAAAPEPGPAFDGASAVHTHMTNTRITDPEVLEHRYPVRLERFAIRAGSGGAGRWRGGDGAVRELTFLEPMSLSLLTQHRVERPYGDGGRRAGPARPPAAGARLGGGGGAGVDRRLRGRAGRPADPGDAGRGEAAGRAAGAATS